MLKIKVGAVYYSVDPIRDLIYVINVLEHRPASGRVSEYWLISRKPTNSIMVTTVGHMLVETEYFHNQYFISSDKKETEKKLMLHRLKHG